MGEAITFILEALLGPYGTVAILILIVVTNYIGWWYTRKEVEEIVRNSAERIADRDIEIARKDAELTWYRNKLFRVLGLGEELKEVISE